MSTIEDQEELNIAIIAKTAANYANKIVVESIADVEKSKHYSDEKFRNLGRFYSDLHNNITQYKAFDYFRLESDDSIYTYHLRILLAKKYSIGVCVDLSFLALEYILLNHKNIRAEVGYLEKGDQAFIVFGRSPNSDLNKPESWGRTTYVYSPFQGVFQARQIYHKLKGYRDEINVTGRKITYTEQFNFSKHSIKALPNINTDHLQSCQDKKYIENVIVAQFKRKLNIIISAVTQLKKDLIYILATHMTQNGLDEISTIIINKIKKIELLLCFLYTQQNNLIISTYSETTYLLQLKLKKSIDETIKINYFDAKEELTVYKHSFFLFRWLGIYSTVGSQTNTGFQKLQDRMETLGLPN